MDEYCLLKCDPNECSGVGCKHFNNPEIRLNLGCGKDILEGFINCDHRMGPGVDLVVDLTMPLPFASESVDEIRCMRVLAHVWNYATVAMPEFYRVLKPGGILIIAEQHGLSHDPYHIRFFFKNTLSCFYEVSKQWGNEDNDFHFELMERYVSKILIGALTIDRLLGTCLNLRHFRFLPFVGRKRHCVWVLKKTLMDGSK